jgi:hypothetical protein
MDGLSVKSLAFRCPVRATAISRKRVKRRGSSIDEAKASAATNPISEISRNPAKDPRFGLGTAENPPRLDPIAINS